RHPARPLSVSRRAAARVSRPPAAPAPSGRCGCHRATEIAMPELAAGRFFDTYGASMDAALAAKAADIEPWLTPGLVVDRGCGTGSLMRRLAAADRKVVGIDISEELSRTHAGVILANIMDPVFADGFVENIVLSSVMHEVYSYQGNSMAAVVVCLSNCARELHPGGRIIIRDMWAP